MDAQNHYQNEEQPKIYGGNAFFNKYVLSFFSEDTYSFRCWSDGEFISDPMRSDREGTFAQVKFCFRQKRLL